MGRLNLSKVIPRRFRKKPSQTIQAQDPHLHFTVTKLQAQISQYRYDLEDAHEEIIQLKKQVAEYDYLLCHAQTRLPNLVPLPPTEVGENLSRRSSSTVSPTSDPVSVWIDDIWLCTETSKELLKTAERHWHHEAPLVALEVVLKTIQDPFLSPLEQIYCHLFTATVQFTLGRFEISIQCLEKAFHMLDDPNESHGDCSKELTGLAYYIQGRLLIATGDLEAAYVSLSRAQNTPGLYSMVRKYQQAVIVESTSAVTDDPASVCSSLQPCLTTGPNSSAESTGSVVPLCATTGNES